jgi:GDPmannose 4,6-dehydratase
MKSALVTGVAGQDGHYLSKLLLEKGYNVYGLIKQRTPTYSVPKGVNIIEGDLTDPSSVNMALKVSYPDEIYNLAAQSHVGNSFKTPQQTCSVNYMGYLNVLLGARSIVPNARIYQAGTSEMFGYAAGSVANEETPFHPKSPYAIAKVAAHWAGVNARHESDQFVSNGILFNHESPYRHADFVTKKITNSVRAILDGILETLKLGNIDSCRDWGYAGDFVEGMWRMLQHDKPDDFVLATGEVHSVREFVTAAFLASGNQIVYRGKGMDEKGYVDGRVVMEIDPKFYRPNDLTFLRGNYNKAYAVLGWQPKVKFQQLVSIMVNK